MDLGAYSGSRVRSHSGSATGWIWRNCFAQRTNAWIHHQRREHNHKWQLLGVSVGGMVQILTILLLVGLFTGLADAQVLQPANGGTGETGITGIGYHNGTSH